ncbi:MAG: response regulator transcription factor [Lachnospiraceae bacterium]|nr:response regulator transcription factor [Lachnospiraceae bacterium]
MAYIYVIEDEENIRELIKIALEGFGHEVSAFEAAEPALESMKEKKPDLAVFDWMLPGISGVEAIKAIRGMDGLSKMPMLLLTAKDKELDKVVGLDSGADDYMTKPFGVLELAARVRSLLRRGGKDIGAEGDTVVCGKLTLNKKTREVWFDGQKAELTFKEYELLQYLLENRDRVVSRDELLNHIWGYSYDGETRTLDIHIRTLRQKLGEKGQDYIKTSRGVGYRLVGDEQA